MHPFLLMSALHAVARADDVGTILQVEGPYLYVSLGSADGLGAGSTVYLYRSVQTSDVGGRRTLTEDFLVGSGRTVEAGLTMSRVEADLSTLAQLRVGDRATVRPILRPPPAPLPRSEGPSADRVTPRMRPAAADLYAVLEANLGATADDRRAALVAWVARWPDDALRPAVQAELQALARATLESPDGLGSAPVEGAAGPPPEVNPPIAAAPTGVLLDPPPPPLPYRADLVVPMSARPGAPVPIVLSLSEPDALSDVTAMWRRQGDALWTPTAMTPYGDSARWAELPAQNEGAIEVFVTATQGDGRRVEAGSSAELPRVVPVEGRRQAEDSPDRTLRIRYDHDRLSDRPGHKQFDQALVAYHTPLSARSRHSLAVMGGRLVGATGDGRPVTLQYGRTALSLLDDAPVGLTISGMMGTDRRGINAGRGLGLRLGHLDRAAFSTSFTDWGRAGVDYRLDLDWGTVPTVPMRAGLRVTNLPDDLGQLGLLLDLEAHHPFTEHFGLGLRIGYGLRRIDAAGLSAGLSTELSW